LIVGRIIRFEWLVKAVRALQGGFMSFARYPLLAVFAFSLLIPFYSNRLFPPNRETPFVFTAVSATGTGKASAAIQEKPTYQSTGLEGELSGTAFFEGTPLPPSRIDMEQDPACEKANPEQVEGNLVVTDGRLANVFVYIKGPLLDEYGFRTPDEAVTLHHAGCMFSPRVLGVLTNQPIVIVNDDQTTHNTHPFPEVNAEWNFSMAAGAQPVVKTFARMEAMIPVNCHQHPWERAFIGVLPHPFFAVTDLQGAFRIRGIPPGTYTVIAWHEKFGEKTAEITITPNKSVSQDFAYEGLDG
jgi:hypothetical protein